MNEQRPSNVRVPEPTWNPRELLQELMLENQYDDNDIQATTSRLLREHAVVASESIAHLASYGNNERVRLQAAQYIVDKTLGGGFDHDFRLQQEQQKLLGQAIFAAIRALGLRFGFSPDDPEVRQLAHNALIATAKDAE